MALMKFSDFKTNRSEIREAKSKELANKQFTDTFKEKLEKLGVTSVKDLSEEQLVSLMDSMKPSNEEKDEVSDDGKAVAEKPVDGEEQIEDKTEKEEPEVSDDGKVVDEAVQIKGDDMIDEVGQGWKKFVKKAGKQLTVDPKAFIVDAYNNGYSEEVIVGALQKEGRHDKDTAETYYYNMVGQYENDTLNEVNKDVAILKVAAKADGEGLSQIAGSFGVDYSKYDLENEDDQNSLYDELEEAIKNAKTSYVHQVWKELKQINLVESTSNDSYIPVDEMCGRIHEMAKAYDSSSNEEETYESYIKECQEMMGKMVNEEINEAEEIKSDEEFKEYATTILKKAFGDKFDEEKANKTIEGILKKSDGDYGAAVGMIKSSLG